MRVAVLLLIAAALTSCATPAAQPPPTPPTAGSAAAAPSAGTARAPAGWTQVWRDDFDGPAGSPPSTANWLHDTGTCYPGCPAKQWGTGEIETMTDSTANVAMDGNGHLAITPVREGDHWTSGRIETRRADFQPPPGGALRVEAALRLPEVGADGAGYWPAFWMLGAALRDGYQGWPGIGEVDVMESVNGRPSVFAAMHCGSLPDGPCKEVGGGLGSPEHPSPPGFHTFAAELDYSTSPQQVRWYLDGVQFHTVTAAQVDADTWQRATQHGFFLILNVAIGGQFPKAYGGEPGPTTVSGRPMLVDHVAVYTKAT
ncbi:family 16 glycosylhydrolase [Solihabitans fulvus]|uniref:Family 16 glycosylhydrolase n=1 Tax=Solihabitans fulvus TaxID=1892852 RepID=A0A5B2WZW1_9PSEU|nr:glycoside hydrolase family 16 protein [Solihabitans fulvus]KAA2256372.1 family 16 glycosylhydrolase [Solihabitans fulvus]